MQVDFLADGRHEAASPNPLRRGKKQGCLQPKPPYAIRVALQSFRQWLPGKGRNVSMSSRTEAMHSAALGTLPTSIVPT